MLPSLCTSCDLDSLTLGPEVGSGSQLLRLFVPMDVTPRSRKGKNSSSSAHSSHYIRIASTKTRSGRRYGQVRWLRWPTSRLPKRARGPMRRV